MMNQRNLQSFACKQVTIGNDGANLFKLQEALERFCRQHGIPARAVHQLQVVIDELASNIIKYAWPDGGAHELSLTFALREEAIRLELSDDGVAFNPLDAPAPMPLAAGQRPRPGGVGIHMVRQLVDAIEYARIDQTNHTTITKRVNQERESPSWQ